MKRTLLVTYTSMLALCSLVLGAWFRFGLQPLPAEQPAPLGEASINTLLYLPIVVEAVQPAWLGPDGGLIAAVAAGPQDANRVYAGSWGGGVFRSDDGGLTWRWASRGLGNLTVVCMAADPSNPDIAYAGTYRGGVYKTVDGGNSWTWADQGIQGNAIVYSMVVNPQVPQRVYAATRGLSNNGGQPWAGVTYRSDDGGASWYSVLSNLGGSGYQDWTYMLAISRTSPSTLLAATHEHGIYKTTNSGGNWGAANNGITGNTRLTTRAIGIVPTTASASTAYTGVWTGEGAFKTTNLGGSWTQKSSGIGGANIYGLDIDYANPQKVYLATYNQGVMSTSSGGNSWSNAALSNRPVSTVRVHPANSALIFAGTAGLGLYASRDSGGSWSPSMAGLQASSATGLVVSPLNPSELYTGVDGGGVQVSGNGGLIWSDFSANIGSQWVNGLVQQPGSSVLFAFTEGAGLYRCDLQNLALCWDQVGGNLPTDSQQDAIQSQPIPGNDAPRRYPAYPTLLVPRPFSPFTTFQDAYPPDSLSIEAVPGNYGLLAMAFSPSNPNIAYIGSSTGGAYASSDGGFNWQAAGLSSQTVWALAVDPLDPQTVYAATSQEGVVKLSTNGGGSWNNSSIPNRDVYALAVSPANPGAPLAGTDNGVFQLIGGSWQSIGLVGQTVAWITINPADPLHILAGTTDGAYTTIDGGITWQPVSAELAGHTVQNISLDPFNPGIAYYSTTAHGVLKASSGK